MMQPNLINSSATLDPTLARLIDDMTGQLQRGEPVDLSAVLHEHPQYAEELRELLPALAALGDLSQSAQNGQASFPLGDDANGTLGDFRLVREVGRGGMGVVYEAEQISLNRRVALKVLPFAATMDAKQLQRFRNEAMAAASLRHENIVHVYGVGCERSVHFYAMELIDGQTLAEIIAVVHRKPVTSNLTSEFEPAGAAAPTAPVGALSTEFTGAKGRELYRSAARIIADAADALEHAHQLGIVHRDIKPANLMVDAAGKVYVTDFGLARFGPDAGLTISGDLLGTLRYMSPEQAMARHGLMDHRTDIYSLGATLYELLTGRPAVAGEDKQEILRNLAFGEPVSLRRSDRTIPAELETITLKAVAKNPADRYAMAKEMADDLRRYCDDKPIKAKPPSAATRLRRFVRRHRVIVSLSTLFVTVLGISAVTAWAIQRNHITRNRDDAYQLNSSLVAAWTAAQSGDFDTVKRQVNEVLIKLEECQPRLAESAVWMDSFRSLFTLGEQLSKGGRHALAAEVFSGCLKQPEIKAARRALLYQCRGDCLDVLGREAQADEDYLEALRYAPSNRERANFVAFRLQKVKNGSLPSLARETKVSQITEQLDTVFHQMRDTPNSSPDGATVSLLINLSREYEEKGEFTRCELLLMVVHPYRNVAARLGRALLLHKRYAEAEPYLREGLIRAEQSNEGSNANLRSHLGEALVCLGRFDEAEPLLLEGYKGCLQVVLAFPYESHREGRLREAAERITLLYDATNQPEKAQAWREQVKSDVFERVWKKRAQVTPESIRAAGGKPEEPREQPVPPD